MAINIEAIIFYIILIDSIMANLIAWGYAKWYNKHFKTFSNLFPIKKMWCLLYLVLVLWVGCTLWRLGVLPY